MKYGQSTLATCYISSFLPSFLPSPPLHNSTSIIWWDLWQPYFWVPMHLGNTTMTLAIWYFGIQMFHIYKIRLTGPTNSQVPYPLGNLIFWMELWEPKWEGFHTPTNSPHTCYLFMEVLHRLYHFISQVLNWPARIVEAPILDLCPIGNLHGIVISIRLGLSVDQAWINSPMTHIMILSAKVRRNR